MPAAIRCASPSTTAVLPTPGSPDEHGVVLRAPREDLHDPLDLGLAADDGVELALGGLLREVAAELVEQLRALRLLARRLPLLAAAGPGEHADDLVADLLGIGVEVEEDARRDALVLAHEAEQDVLGADVVVAERESLAERELQHLLRARRERDLPARHLVALADDARHLGPHLLDGDVEGLEHPRGQAFLLAEEAEQDVLGADVVVLQGTGFVLREDDDLPGTLCEPLEHSEPIVPHKGRIPCAPNGPLNALATKPYGLPAFRTPGSAGLLLATAATTERYARRDRQSARQENDRQRKAGERELTGFDRLDGPRLGSLLSCHPRGPGRCRRRLCGSGPGRRRRLCRWRRPCCRRWR